MQKQLIDLLPGDLLRHPVWYHPLDDTSEDEATIRPAETAKDLEDRGVILVKTEFTDRTGRQYLGTIYWDEEETIDRLRPFVFLDYEDAQSCLVFYFGLAEPKPEQFAAARGILRASSFPIGFQSCEVFGFKPIRGELSGLYYLDQQYRLVCTPRTRLACELGE